MRVAFVSDRDVSSRNASTHHAMFHALEPRVDELVHIRTQKPAGLASRIARKLRGEVRRFDTKWVNERIRTARSILSGRVSRERFDVVFAPMGSTSLAGLEADIPVVYTSDATSRLMDGYYESHTGLSDDLKHRLDAIEGDAIRSASWLPYPTSWVAGSAVEHFGAERERVEVIPYGANIDRWPERIPRDRPGARLLLMGLEWRRKGADTAVEAVRILRQRGVEATLTVMGCTPPAQLDRTDLRLEPFFNKDTPEGAAKFERAMREHDIFILPSKAECFGHVMCEAAAYSMPLLANRTGGLSEVVIDGKTGYLIGADEGPEGYASRIEEMLSDGERYLAMSRAARDDFEQRLNWDAWGDRVAAGMRDRFA